MILVALDLVLREIKLNSNICKQLFCSISPIYSTELIRKGNQHDLSYIQHKLSFSSRRRISWRSWILINVQIDPLQLFLNQSMLRLILLGWLFLGILKYFEWENSNIAFDIPILAFFMHRLALYMLNKAIEWMYVSLNSVFFFHTVARIPRVTSTNFLLFCFKPIYSRTKCCGII